MYTSLRKTMEEMQEIHQNDPVHKCEVYKEEGCSFVDGYLCEYHDCSILKRYKDNERKDKYL